MSADVKRKALVFIFLALLATMLVGAALPRLVLQPGMPPPKFADGEVAVVETGSDIALGISASAFFIVLMGLISSGLVVYVVYRVIKGVDWREVLSGLASIVFALVVIMGILFFITGIIPTGQAPVAVQPLPLPQPVVTAPLGPPPVGLLWLVAGGLLALAIVVGLMMIRSRPKPAFEAWRIEAENARDALLAGEDLRDVILQCYRRMSQALQEDQQIVRDEFMTAQEFEHLLAGRGVPTAPVHQLTQLFEMVRYGHWQPGSGEEQRAIDCLDAILAYSREAAQAAAK